MANWIKIETTLIDKPEVVELAWLLKLTRFDIVGRLVAFWSWVDSHSADGNARGVTKEFVDEIAGVQKFADAMEKVGWLIVKNGGISSKRSGRIEGISIPNFQRHNGKSAKNRVLTAERVKRSRNDGSVTKSAPEKNREEKRREDEIEERKEEKKSAAKGKEIASDSSPSISPEEEADGVRNQAMVRWMLSVGPHMPHPSTSQRRSDDTTMRNLFDSHIWPDDADDGPSRFAVVLEFLDRAGRIPKNERMAYITGTISSGKLFKAQPQP